MLAFILIWSVSRFAIRAVIVLQFLIVLLSGEKNARLGDFGGQLASYTQQLIRYLTFNSEEKPFPFDRNWPKA